MNTHHSKGADYAVRVFYVVVAGVALIGQSQAATVWLGWHIVFALAAMGAVEFGGIALAMFADARRQLGERAFAARVLSAAVAGFAVAVNWFGHANDVGLAAFFAGMSLLGYLVYLISSGAARRDAMRADGTLAAVPPAYGLTRWMLHPVMTARARALALTDPTLGLVGSIRAADDAGRRARRVKAVAVVLEREIRATAQPADADLALAAYDLDKVAQAVADAANYTELAAWLSAPLSVARLAGTPATTPSAPTSAESPAALAFRAALARPATWPHGPLRRESSLTALNGAGADRDG